LSVTVKNDGNECTGIREVESELSSILGVNVIAADGRIRDG
jgi:hypothetical protein